jgi:hypothetical protein
MVERTRLRNIREVVQLYLGPTDDDVTVGGARELVEIAV